MILRQKHRPTAHINRLIPTDPVAAKMLDGVENIPVPIILFRIKNIAPATPIFWDSGISYLNPSSLREPSRVP
jgi:hypothetical protein